MRHTYLGRLLDLVLLELAELLQLIMDRSSFNRTSLLCRGSSKSCEQSDDGELHGVTVVMESDFMKTLLLGVEECGRRRQKSKILSICVLD